jgi:hypothetical protein
VYVMYVCHDEELVVRECVYDDAVEMYVCMHACTYVFIYVCRHVYKCDTHEHTLKKLLAKSEISVCVNVWHV